MDTLRTVIVTLLAAILAISAVSGVGLVGAVHPDDAPDKTDQADFVVNLPSPTDHHPGDQNEENGSIEYFASGASAFDDLDAEEGVFIDWVIVHAEYEGVEWIDYSACDTPNTEVFGIDRGNNNSGTQTDEDLVSKQKKVNFRDDGIVINFYEWSDFGGDPPYMAPEDAIIAAQGAGSSAGPCLTMTEEPGWYRIAAFMNGTVADNGRNTQPSDGAEEVSLELNSNFLYVCDCDSEAEARDKLGPPPDEEQQTGDETPTPTPTPEPETPTPDDSEDESTPTPEPETATPDDSADDQTDESSGSDSETKTPTPESANEADEPDSSDSINGTPTPGDGPGFGAGIALLALLTGGLLARRR